jgi:hypothetical protein
MFVADRLIYARPCPCPGRLVSGPTLALIMAMAGRALYCDELDGEGSAILRERCTTVKA